MQHKSVKTLRVRPGKGEGTIVEITPQSAGWEYAGLAVHRLSSGAGLTLPLLPLERCVVVLSGIVTIAVGGEEWPEVGARQSVFEDVAPHAVYMPGGAKGSLTALTGAEIAVASAPDSAMRYPPRLIEPGEMARTERGRGTNLRYICDVLPATQPATSLLVVEVRTPASHSSSYPPHKHDRDALPEESGSLES